MSELNESIKWVETLFRNKELKLRIDSISQIMNRNAKRLNKWKQLAEAVESLSQSSESKRMEKFYEALNSTIFETIKDLESLFSYET